MKVHLRRRSILGFLLLALFVAATRDASPEAAQPEGEATLSVSEDRTKLLLGGKALLEAQADGFRSIHEIKYAPTREHALVIACGFECTDNVGFLLKADGTGKHKFTAPWDFIFQSKAEWAEDGQSVFYYRINSTGADPPRKAPRKGWVRVDVKTGRKSPGTGRSLKLNATYGILSLSGRRALKVYADPQPKARIISTLPSYAKGIKVTGEGVKVGREMWVPVRFQGISGWVNQDHLFEESGAD